MWSWRCVPTAIFFVLSAVLFGTPPASANQHEWQQFSQETDDEILILRLGRTRARINVSSQECLGEFWGEVTRYDDHIKLYDPNRTNRAYAGECELTLWPLEDGGYRIDESFDCLNYHGALCDLSGFVYPAVEDQRQSQPAFNPSFSCVADLNSAEEAICNDIALSKLDQLLSTIYVATISLSDEGLIPQDADNVRLRQRAWVHERNNCSSDESCLAFAYHSRLSQLTEHWIMLPFDVLWPLMSSHESLDVLTDGYGRIMLFSKADTTNAHPRSVADSVYENIFVFDPDGRLINRSFDDVHSPCENEFSIIEGDGSDHPVFRRALVCGYVNVVHDDSYRLSESCIEPISIYRRQLDGALGREWYPVSAGLCAEDNLQRGADLIWAWDESIEPMSADEPDESSIALLEPAQNFMKFSENFINYWLSPSIQSITDMELDTTSCPASELTVNYVKLLNFYHNILLTSNDDVSESEALSVAQPTFGYTSLGPPGNSDINSRFRELLDDYRRHEAVARPLLIMTLNVLNQNGSAVALIDDLLLAYEFEQNPSEYPNSLYPCNLIKVSNGTLYDITYWNGFDTYGFWQRRRGDGTASFVYDTLVSLRDEIGN